MVIQGDANAQYDAREHDLNAAEVLAELNRILASDEFAGSAALRAFLKYCVEQSLGDHPENLSEHSIAVHVFIRRDNFDGRVDTIVRVQAHRLRVKLSNYYNGEGRNNPIQISIPKGSYQPSFRRQASEPAPLLAAPPPGPQPASAVSPRPHKRTVLLGAMFLAGIGVGLLGAWIGGPGEAHKALSPAVRELWGPMLTAKPAAAQIIYQPTVFVSNRSVLLRYRGPYDAPTDTPIAELDKPIGRFVDQPAFATLGQFVFNYSWAPVGIAAEAHYLTKMFASAGRPVQLRAIGHSEPNELGERDVILLDSHSEADVFKNPVFTLETSEPENGSNRVGTVEFGRIMNHSPAPGEPSFFTIEHRADTQARTVDYGLFSIRRNSDGESSIALFSGITTFGDWGAVQHMTSDKGAADLVERLGSPLPPSLQAVIRVTIERNTVKSMELVAARALE